MGKSLQLEWRRVVRSNRIYPTIYLFLQKIILILFGYVKLN